MVAINEQNGWEGTWAQNITAINTITVYKSLRSNVRPRVLVIQ